MGQTVEGRLPGALFFWAGFAKLAAGRLNLVQFKPHAELAMKSINIHEAKTHLSRLIERVQAGEEFVIAKAGRPAARLVPLESPIRRIKSGGRIDKSARMNAGGEFPACCSKVAHHHGKGQ